MFAQLWWRWLWVLFLAAVSPAARAQFEWATNAGTITLVRYTGTGGDLMIPADVDGLPVTEVGMNAFASCLTLTRVVVPDSVIRVGMMAFVDCANLGTVVLGKGVAEIGYHAFFGCSGLTAFEVDSLNPTFRSVDGVLFTRDQATLLLCPARKAGSYGVPGGVASIADGAFDHCVSLTRVTFPDSLTNIQSGAFYACGGLAEVAFGTNLATLGNLAFYACTNLTQVTIPDSVTSIYGAFSDCSGLTQVTLGANITNVGGAFVRCSRLSTVVLPPRLRVIGGMAFAGCSSLTNVVIPGTVTDIEGSAFSACGSLTGVELPPGLTRIGAYAFEHCTNLNRITIPAGVGTLERYVFTHCASLRTFDIPDNVTNIQWAAFSECSGLTQVRIGKGVAAIEDWVFSRCGSLTAILVDAANATFSSLDGVLFDKSGTTLIKYPEGRAGRYEAPIAVTRIQSYAFQDASGLTTVQLPAGVTNLGSQVFANCALLTAVSFAGDAPEADASVFAGSAAAIVYYAPGRVNWESTLSGRPTALWNPEMPTGGPDFGVVQGAFGFTVTGSTNLVLVIEANESLLGGGWVALATNALTTGSFDFRDTGWTNASARFYRLRSP